MYCYLASGVSICTTKRREPFRGNCKFRVANLIAEECENRGEGEAELRRRAMGSFSVEKMKSLRLDSISSASGKGSRVHCGEAIPRSGL